MIFKLHDFYQFSLKKNFRWKKKVSKNLICLNILVIIILVLLNEYNQIYFKNNENVRNVLLNKTFNEPLL